MKATKPTTTLTDIKCVTRLFQTKAILSALWNALDYVLQFNFKIAHISGSVNAAADFLSRLELKVTERKRLKNLEVIQTIPNEPQLPQMSLMENNFSSHKQTRRTIQKNKSLDEKNNLDKMRSKG